MNPNLNSLVSAFGAADSVGAAEGWQPGLGVSQAKQEVLSASLEIIQISQVHFPLDFFMNLANKSSGAGSVGAADFGAVVGWQPGLGVSQAKQEVLSASLEIIQISQVHFPLDFFMNLANKSSGAGAVGAELCVSGFDGED